MITLAQKQQLRELGYSEAAISAMTPEEAHRILACGPDAPGRRETGPKTPESPMAGPAAVSSCVDRRRRICRRTLGLGAGASALPDDRQESGWPLALMLYTRSADSAFFRLS